MNVMLHYYDKDRMVRTLAAKLGKSTQEVIEIAVARMFSEQIGRVPKAPSRDPNTQREGMTLDQLAKPRSLDDVMRGTE